MYQMTDDEFDAVVQEALDGMPARFMDALENMAIFVQDEPEDADYEILDDPECLGGTVYDDELLGLYDGVPLTERADYYELDAPDNITIFKGPHERSFHSREEVVDEVRKTVIHEIGHYFGLDDDRLYEMGY